VNVLLGCIADDFTGATDLANTLVKAGMRTIQLLGVPGSDLEVPEADCIIVALKSRSNPAPEAVQMSLAALEWLRGRSPRQYYFKYCSTFDSTDKGNIGPVADALLDKLGEDSTRGRTPACDRCRQEGGQRETDLFSLSGGARGRAGGAACSRRRR